MFTRLGNFVSRHWLLTILIWIVVVVVVRRNSPEWDAVTHDGDLAYMPARMPSVQGERLLEQAFPEGRAKSDVVVIIAREDHPIDGDDFLVIRSFVSRFQNLVGTSSYERYITLKRQADELAEDDHVDDANRIFEQAQKERKKAVEAFEAAVDVLMQNVQNPDELLRDRYLAYPAYNLSILKAEDGNSDDAQYWQRVATDLNPKVASIKLPLADSRGALPLIDAWSRYTEKFGDNLVSKDQRADLILLRLSNEFMASENIPFLELVEDLIEETTTSLGDIPEGLTFGLSGSAAVGSDMLRSAKESMDSTELFTVVLVITILLFVYRSPVLIVVPLVSIIASLLVATSVVATLTTLNQWPGMDWWDFKIFTTTKIFVVVILFGAGTDYCLFLIARYKEELDAGKAKGAALADALGGVGEALAASALTTILGLATMYFAQFGKFRNSGPAIGLCLFVTLLACVTLAPALLRALGSSVYWTIGFRSKSSSSTSISNGDSTWWNRMAEMILAKPATILMVCTIAMVPLFLLGFQVDITYDLLSELSPDRASKQGAVLLEKHFAHGESGPLTILAHKPNADFDSQEGMAAIRSLTGELYLEGVQSVRSLVAPSGGTPKSGTTGLIRQNYPLARQLYLSKLPSLGGDVARLLVILDHDPFSLDAIETLQRVDQRLKQIQADETSYWAGSEFVFAGTTAAIRDLREVTSADNIRIQQLVVIAVFVILLILLKRPAVCVYLILSVLFSYYVTIGTTQLFFQWAYGPTFEGLDWKVPLFLFVILVAIGQDYNIYLVTRVFEEQAEHGMFEGLRLAIVRTGGIITSCGVIMAGTFLSMMTGSMRGIVELGFALTLGVLLDTFVVRPVLVPAFLAILFRYHAKSQAT